MEVTEYNIGVSCQLFNGHLPDSYPDCNLGWMGQQTVAHIAQGNTRIDDNPLFPCLHQAAQATLSRRLCSNYFQDHKSLSVVQIRSNNF